MSWWRSKPKSKFSLENLKYLYSQLQKYPTITKQNQQTVVECLRAIAELMIWGDQHNAGFFDFFCEKGILAHFVRLLGQNCDPRVKVQIIQTLSILVQNTSSEMSVFYLLSNNHINDLIAHRFDFSHEELLAYYISFLKTLSLKLNSKTVLFFFNEHANDFPLYTEAIKFFNHPESMVRAAVRTLSLNVYKTDYEPMRRFILDRSAVPYFSNLSWFLRDQTLELEHVMEKSTYLSYSKLEEMVESHIDLFYYLQDILSLGIDELSHKLTDQLLSQFVLPLLVGSILYDKGADEAADPASSPSSSYPPPVAGSLPAPADAHSHCAKHSADSHIATRLALFLLTQIFLVFTDSPFLNSVATALLDPTPPRLACALIASPPAHPVSAHCPLTTILFPKSARTFSPSPIPTPPSGAAPAVAPAAASASDPDSLPAAAPSPPAGNGGGSVSRHELKDLPPDENLKARSKLPEVGPTVSLEELCPDYAETCSDNPYREALFRCLSDPDERVVLACIGCILSIIRNECVDREVLARADLLPQVQRKARSILAELTAAAESPRTLLGPAPASQSRPHVGLASGSAACIASAGPLVHVSLTIDLPGEAKEGIPQPEVRVELGLPPYRPLPASDTLDAEDGGEEADQAAEGAGPAALPLPAPVAASEASEEQGADSEAEADPAARDAGPIPSDALERKEEPAGRALTEEAREEAGTEDSVPEYCAELVTPLLSVLHRQPSCTLVTLQVASELLTTLCYHRGRDPCLTSQHLRILDVAYRAITAGLTAAFSGPLSPFLLDLMEDEWNNAQKPINYKSLVTNALTMLPIADNPISGAPLDFRRPSGDTERTRKAVQVFFLLRNLRTRMRNLPESFPLALESPKVKPGDEVEMVGVELIPCRIIVPLEPGQQPAARSPTPKTPPVFLILDKCIFLLVERHPSKANWAVVLVALPARHQEALVSRSNVSVLHVALRCQIRPHPACKRIPPPEAPGVSTSTVGGISALSIKAATAQAASGLLGAGAPAASASPPPDTVRPVQPFSAHNRWQITLLFPEPSQCADAKRHLEAIRTERRAEVVEKILAYMA